MANDSQPIEIQLENVNFLLDHPRALMFCNPWVNGQPLTTDIDFGNDACRQLVTFCTS